MITIYTKPNCAHCVSAKEYLAVVGVPYREIDVTEDAEAVAFLRAHDHRTVPQLYSGETLLVEGGNQALQRLSGEQVRQLLGDLVPTPSSDR